MATVAKAKNRRGWAGCVAKYQVPAWTWGYVTFRIADGLVSQLIPLAVYFHYHMPLWAMALTTALMNLAGVPGTFLWGAVMDRWPQRRAVVTGGFVVASAALAVMATLPAALWMFILAAILFAGFGVATAPAASTLVLQGAHRDRWAEATAALGKRTGFSYLVGFGATISVGLWRHQLNFPGLFAAASVLCLGAAVIAVRALPPWRVAMPHETAYDRRVAQSGPRFERVVFFPGRLRHVPQWRALRASMLKGHRLWPLGFTLTFMGSVCFFASYQGVLASELGLAAGIVLLCQAPSNVVSPLAYPWAARFGQRHGDHRGVLMGSRLRQLALPALMFLVALAPLALRPGAVPLLVPLIMAGQGLMGLSFALLQVNGVVLMARVHPKGRGQGVGTYHAAVGLGTLLGSGMAYVLLRAFDEFRVSYAAALLVGALGGVLLLVAARQAARERPHIT